MKRARVCAIVVTFNPDEGLRERLANIASQANPAVVVDNASRAAARDVVQSSAAALGLTPLSNSKNLGIGAALNQGVRWAVERGFEWALLLDQDSEMLESALDVLVGIAEAVSADPPVAIVAAKYSHAGRHQSEASAAPSRPNEWEEIGQSIFSGSLLRLDAYRSVGSFREEFFMDRIDEDFSLRLKDAGYRILRTKQVLMVHAMGRPTPHRLTAQTWWTGNYPPRRRYLITRNLLVLGRERVRRNRKWVLRELYLWALGILLVALFEKDRWPKLIAVAKGVIDGLARHMNRPLTDVT